MEIQFLLRILYLLPPPTSIVGSIDEVGGGTRSLLLAHFVRNILGGTRVTQAFPSLQRPSALKSASTKQNAGETSLSEWGCVSWCFLSRYYGKLTFVPAGLLAMTSTHRVRHARYFSLSIVQRRRR